MKHHRNQGTLAIDIVRALCEKNDRSLWRIIEVLSGVIESSFESKLVQRSGINADVVNILERDLGCTSPTDTWVPIYDKLKATALRPLRQFDEGMLYTDFWDWERAVDFNHPFMQFCRSVLEPRTLGESLVAEHLSHNVREQIASLNKARTASESLSKAVVGHCVRVLNKILEEEKLLHTDAFGAFVNDADFVSKTRQADLENPTDLLSENWQLMYAAYPRGFVTKRWKTRNHVRSSDINPVFFIAHVVAGLRLCDRYLMQQFTDRECADIRAFVKDSDVDKVMAMLLVCADLNKMLAQNVLRQVQRTHEIIAPSEYLRDLEVVENQFGIGTLAAERLALHQNRHLLQSVFPTQIVPYGVKFEKWMRRHITNVHLGIRWDAIKRNKARLASPKVENLEPDEVRVEQSYWTEEDIVLKILEEGCQLGEEPILYERILQESFLDRVSQEEIADRLNALQYNGVHWSRRKVHNVIIHALELIGQYMYLHYDDIIDGLLNRYPDKRLSVLSVDCIPKSAFTCPSSNDNFYLFSGFTHTGQTVVLPSFQGPNVQAAFEWLLGKGFGEIRWVISDDIENIHEVTGQYFPRSRWQYCHSQIRKTLNYKPHKEEVLSIIGAPSRAQAMEQFHKHRQVFFEKLSIAPESLLQALNYLDLEFADRTRAGVNENRIKSLNSYHRERSHFHSTRFPNIERRLRIKKDYTRMRVRSDLEMFLAGKRFISPKANKVRMPVWDSSK